jgi:hypothetical protein
MNWLTNCGKTRADHEEPRAGTRAGLTSHPFSARELALKGCMTGFVESVR